jgi:hypothetical protein
MYKSLLISSSYPLLRDLRVVDDTYVNLLQRPSLDSVALCGDTNGDLVMLSITVPWYSSVGNALSTKELSLVGKFS